MHFCADADAGCIKKGGQSTLGYKGFAHTDEDGFVDKVHANATQSKLRARVEHPFAHQKRPMGPVIRTIGIARANPTITLANIAYTMKRWQWLDSQPAPA